MQHALSSFLLAVVEEGEARGPWVEEGGHAAAVEEGGPGVLAAVKEGGDLLVAEVKEREPGDRAFLLAAVEEGEARGPAVPIVEGETGSCVEEGGPAVPKPAGSVSKESL